MPCARTADRKSMLFDWFLKFTLPEAGACAALRRPACARGRRVAQREKRAFVLQAEKKAVLHRVHVQARRERAAHLGLVLGPAGLFVGLLVGTSLQTDRDYLDASYERPCFLLIGNEQQGLPEAYEAECDLLVKIPMLGRADSLNAAIAAAVMGFAVRASWRG